MCPTSKDSSQPPALNPQLLQGFPLCALCENMKYGNAGKAKSCPWHNKMQFPRRGSRGSATEYTLLISGNNNKEHPNHLGCTQEHHPLCGAAAGH